MVLHCCTIGQPCRNTSKANQAKQPMQQHAGRFSCNRLTQLQHLDQLQQPGQHCSRPICGRALHEHVDCPVKASCDQQVAAFVVVHGTDILLALRLQPGHHLRQACPSSPAALASGSNKTRSAQGRAVWIS